MWLGALKGTQGGHNRNSPKSRQGRYLLARLIFTVVAFDVHMCLHIVLIWLHVLLRNKSCGWNIYYYYYCHYIIRQFLFAWQPIACNKCCHCYAHQHVHSTSHVKHASSWLCHSPSVLSATRCSWTPSYWTTRWGRHSEYSTLSNIKWLIKYSYCDLQVDEIVNLLNNRIVI